MLCFIFFTEQCVYIWTQGHMYWCTLFTTKNLNLLFKEQLPMPTFPENIANSHVLKAKRVQVAIPHCPISLKIITTTIVSPG